MPLTIVGSNDRTGSDGRAPGTDAYVQFLTLISSHSTAPPPVTFVVISGLDRTHYRINEIDDE